MTISKILKMPGYDVSETLRLHGTPCKSTDIVVVTCRDCKATFNRKIKDLRSFLVDGFRCANCAAKSRGEQLRGKHNRDWSVIASNLLGFSSADTLEHFGYMYPKRGIDKIVLRCSCNEVAFYRASDALIRYQEKSYQCKSCAAFIHNAARLPDYSKRLSEYEEFCSEKTYENFGYYYPKLSTDQIIVKCIHCNTEKSYVTGELLRSKKYRCKICSAKSGYAQRQKAMQSALHQYWDDENNRERHSEIAKNQPHRSTNMKTLNRRQDFQEARIAGLSNSSKGELEVLDFIKSLGFDAGKKIFVGDTRSYEIDIFIPEKNIGIEHNGLYYHRLGSKHIDSKNYHLNKTIFFAERDIQIIHVWETEWKWRKKQIKCFLSSLLGINKTISARDCEVYTLEKKDGVEFVNKYNIEKHIKGNLYIGFSYRNELVATAILYQKELRGFVCKEGISVTDALPLLTEQFENIFTWCDLRWSNGSEYKSAGWKKIEQKNPAYKFTNGRNFFNKKEDGFWKIYDCGKIKYEHLD